jgi:hypothetical protein
VADDETDDDGWDEDEGPGPDWQPRPMTGSGPIFSGDSYPRATASPEDTDARAPVMAETATSDPAAASASNDTGDLDTGATVASNTPTTATVDGAAPAESE